MCMLTSRRSLFSALAAAPLMPVVATATTPLRVKLHANPECECGYCMSYLPADPGKLSSTMCECVNPRCKHYGVRFKIPVVVLERA